MSSSPSPPVAGNAGDAPASPQSKLYKIIVTPIIFVSFLLSLVWIDFANNIKRSHFHSTVPGDRPSWLHRFLCRPQPYQYDRTKGQGAGGLSTSKGSAAADEWHYHSKQKQLFKMEMADALEIRSTVLVILLAASVGVAWATWLIGHWLVLRFKVSGS